MTATAGSGYRVRYESVAEAGRTFGEQAETIETVHSSVVGMSLPATAFGGLPQSSAAATAHDTAVKEAGEQLETSHTTTSTVATGLTTSAKDYHADDEIVAGWYRSLDSTATSQAPAPVSGTGGFAGAIARNHDRVSQALGTELDTLRGLQAQRSALNSLPGGELAAGGLDQQIAASQKKIDLYQAILADNRQILQFDPSGNGRIVELFGSIDGSTKNIGVLVPGTNTSLTNYDSYATTAQDWVNADPNHDLAMVVYADGRNPQNVITQSPSPSYANTMAPDLASFSHDLRSTADATGADPTITTVAHSYAASTVGAAEKLGYDTDRLVDVEGAGVGPGVWDPSQLPDSAHVQRFSETAPYDPMGLFQGRATIELPTDTGQTVPLTISSPHGADPDTFGNTVRLDPGNVPHDPWLGPFDVGQHTAVLKPYSDSWTNILSVLTGQQPRTLP